MIQKPLAVVRWAVLPPLLAALGVASAWSQPYWTQVSSLPGIGRCCTSMAYDAARRRIVIFGGWTPMLLDETWEYDGTIWTRGPSAPAGLTPRMYHTLAFDSGRSLIVLFGGDDASGRRNDTWEYDGTVWSQGPPAPAGLVPRSSHGMVYQRTRARTIVLGGIESGTVYLKDMWEYDGNAWTPGPALPSGFDPRGGFGMAYDEGRDRVVVFGGRNVAGTHLNDTWILDSSGWHLGPAAPPGLTPRWAPGMAWAAGMDRVVLFGGSDGGSKLADTWELSIGGWASGASGPSGRYGQGMACGADRGRIVMFGGSYPPPNDTWEYGFDSGAGDFLVGEGHGPANANRVRVFRSQGLPTAVSFLAYSAGAWGTNAAPANWDGGATDGIATGPGPGAVYGPQVRGFRNDGTAIAKINFFSYGTLKYGVNVVARSVDTDAYGEIQTGAGPGAVFGPHVRAFNYDAASVSAIAKISFFAYGTLKYGVNVAAGSVDADPFSEILTGAGPGAIFSSQVRGFDYDATAITAIAKINLLAFSTPGYGVNVAAGDVDGDGFEEIACAPGPGSTPAYPGRVVGYDYDGSSIGALAGFDVTAFTTAYGARPGSGAVGPAPAEALVAGAGPDPSADSTVRSFAYDGSALSALPASFVPFGSDPFGVVATGAALGY